MARVPAEAADPSVGQSHTGLAPVEVIRRSSWYLERHGVQSARQDAETLLLHVLREDRAVMYGRSAGLDSREARLFGRALCRRARGTPLQHITGEQQFFDLVLEVRPGVLIPRPETEGLVEAALEVLAGRLAPVVIDVGTGTGAIALAIKLRRPDARVVATDVSEGAVTLARSNAERLGLPLEVRRGDLLQPVSAALWGRVDLLVSNPPYLSPQEYESLPREVKAEPYEALVGGTQLHRRLVEAAPEWLAPGGWLAMEIGATQGPVVRDLLEGAFESVAILPDLAGRDRVARGRLRPNQVGPGLTRGTGKGA